MQMNLQQAVEILDSGNLPYSSANAAKVRGSARKCARLPGYNCDISRIPVDPKVFTDRWSRNMQNKDAPEGFKTFKQFSSWHSNVKSLMEHVSGKRQERDLMREVEDDWSQLLAATADLIRARRKGTGIQQDDLIAVTVLRNIARENNHQPAQLTSGQIHTWMTSSPAGQRSAMRRAAMTLNRLHELDHGLPEHLLPGKFGHIPLVTKRRTTPKLPPKLLKAISDMETDLREGVPYGGLLENLRKDPCSESTIKKARETANWFLSCMVELDFLNLDEDPDPHSFATMSHVQAAFEAEVAGQYYWKPLRKTTIRKNIEGTFSFLRRFNPDLKQAQIEFFKGRFFQNWETMTQENQTFCRRLVKSDQRKAKFFSLARLFHEKAAPMIASFDKLPHNKKAQAINWALAAVTAAILTFLPLRANTAIQLTIDGPEAHVALPRKTRNVNFALPPEIIKNKVRIAAEISRRGKTDSRTILEWWMKEARPLLMARLQNPDVSLLLGGASYVRLNKAWSFATASVDLYMNLHQVRHAIASILWNEPDSDIKVIAALLGDKPEIALLCKLPIRAKDLREATVGKEFFRDSEGWLVNLETSKTGTRIEGRLADCLTPYLDAVLLMDTDPAHLWAIYDHRLGTALFANPARDWKCYEREWLRRNMTKRTGHSAHIVRTLIYDYCAINDDLNAKVAQALVGHAHETSKKFYEVNADQYRRAQALAGLSTIEKSLAE